MRNQKGITLIALTITVVVLLILVSITTYTGLEVVDSGKLTRFRQELEIMQAEVDLLYEKYKEDETIELGKDLLEADTEKSSKAFQSVGIEEERLDYRYFDKETIENLGISGVENEYLVNIETRSVISLDGLEMEDKTYYGLSQITGKIKGNGDINRGNVTFDVTCKTTGNYSANNSPLEEETFSDEITISNMKFSKYVGKAIIQYKDIAESENWITLESNAKGKNYTFRIKGKGTYVIRITDAAKVFAEKTIKRVSFSNKWDATETEEQEITDDEGNWRKTNVKKANITISNITFSSEEAHNGTIQYKKYNNESVITDTDWITVENNATEGRSYTFEVEGEQTYLIRIKDNLERNIVKSMKIIGDKVKITNPDTP